MTTDYLAYISTATHRKRDGQVIRELVDRGKCWESQSARSAGICPPLPEVLLSTAQSMSIFKKGRQKYYAMIIFIAP